LGPIRFFLMQRALTPKQAAFCHAYIETGNASEAYRRAYDAQNMKLATVGRKAQVMLNHAGVAAEIQRLKTRVAHEHDVTVASLIRELEEARQLALKNKQPGAAVNATMGKGKLAGVFSGKPDDDVPPPSRIDVTIRRAKKDEP